MTLGIGSKNKQFTVVLDLESADFWVPASGCVTDGCAGRQTLGATDSTTLNVGSKKWTYGYINGDVTGVLVNDTVNFAGLTLENVAFGLASQVDLGVTNGVFDQSG
jgi:cathepsin D